METQRGSVGDRLEICWRMPLASSTISAIRAALSGRSAPSVISTVKIPAVQALTFGM